MTPPTRVLGRRVAAFVIDALVVLAVCVPLFFALAKTRPAGTVLPSGSPSPGFHSNALVQVTLNGQERYVSGGQAALFMLYCLMIFLLVFALMAAWTGGTPGMHLFGLHVVGEDGSPVRIGRQLARTALWVVDAFPYVIPGVLAFVCALFSARRQRVGDLVARTLVVSAGRR